LHYNTYSLRSLCHSQFQPTIGLPLHLRTDYQVHVLLHSRIDLGADRHYTGNILKMLVRH
jgi:hypothetical protein